jgi:hypothetical protein
VRIERHYVALLWGDLFRGRIWPGGFRRPNSKTLDTNIQPCNTRNTPTMIG